MKTILATVDLSKVSESVVAHAVALARALKGRVIVLTVVQPAVIYPTNINGAGVAMARVDEITEAADKRVTDYLLKIEKHLQNKGIPGESIRLKGAPVERILAQATKHRVAYIVMGSHGHTAAYELFVGSTTHGVLRRSKCPVVIIPPIKKLRGSK